MGPDSSGEDKFSKGCGWDRLPSCPLFVPALSISVFENSCSRHGLPVRSSILGMSWALSPNLGTLSHCLAFLWDIKDEFRRHRACLFAIVLDTTAQTGLKFVILWLPLPEFWNCYCAPPRPLTFFDSSSFLRYVCECFICMYVYVPHTYLEPLENRRVLGPQELELLTVVYPHVGTGNWPRASAKAVCALHHQVISQAWSCALVSALSSGRFPW